MILKKVPFQEGEEYYDYGVYIGKYVYLMKCDNCGVEFQHKNRLKRYCSQKCINEVNVKNRRDLREKTRNKICEYCHKPFQRSRIDSKYCSNACKQGAYRNREVPIEQTALYTIKNKPYSYLTGEQIAKLKDNGIKFVTGANYFSASSIRKLKQHNLEYVQFNNFEIPEELKKAYWNKEITQKELEVKYKKYLQKMKLNTLIHTSKTDRMALMIPFTSFNELENCYSIILPEALKKAMGFKEIISL